MSLEQSKTLSLAFEEVAPHYDRLMESVPYEFWLRYLHRLWGRHKHEPQNVLDIACGTGTVSLLMAREGLCVTGVDLSGRMLAEARRKSGDAGININYVEQDAAGLDLGDIEFDTAVSLFDSLNNITEPAALAECFLRVRKHLLTPGLFVFDVNTAYAFRNGMFDQKNSSPIDPLQYRWQSSYDEASQLCTVNMEFEYRSPPAPPSFFEELHVQRAYPQEELILLLKDAGFARIAVYDAYTLNPPKRRSDRIFFVAETA